MGRLIFCSLATSTTTTTTTTTASKKRLRGAFSCSCEPITELRSVTCHMTSLSITWHRWTRPTPAYSSCFWQIEMEQCECLPLNSKFARKSVVVKTKPFNRQTVISINQLFKVMSTGMNTCPQPWPPLIIGLVDDALLQHSSAFNFCKVVWRHCLGEVGKFYRTVWLIYPGHCVSISIKIGRVL